MTADTDLARLADSLLGTTKDAGNEADRMELASLAEMDASDLESELADHIEVCKGCGWWCEVSELAREDDDLTGYCDDCVPEDR